MNTGPWDREIEQVERDHADGLIGIEERNRRLREIERDYNATAQEAAEDAYRRELGNW